MATDKNVNLNLKTKGDTKGAKQTKDAIKSVRLETERARKSLNAMSSNFKFMATTFLAVAKSVDKLTSLTDKMVTAQNVLNQTFGKTTDSVNDYIDNLAKMTGISNTDIKNKTSLFGQMAVSLGMSTEKASEFSTALDDLSAKLSLLYNIDFNSSAKALLDAVKGESSTLTTLTGIVIKTQSLQNTLNELGINMIASNLTGANLALLQYITVAKEVNATNKDMQQIVNDLAWQKQILRNQVKELANAFGNLLYPILRAILPVLNGILIAITTIINALASLFGITKRSSNNIGGVAEAFDNLGGSIAGATEKAKKSLRPFDKLNNIMTPTPTTGTGGGGGGLDPRLYGEAQKIADQMLKIKNRAQEIADEILKWLGFTKDVNGQLKWSGKTLLKNIYNWWKKLNLLAKLLVGMGLLIGAKKLYKVIKSLVSLVQGSKIWGNFTILANSIKNEGLITTVEELVGSMTLLERSIGAIGGALVMFQGIGNIANALKDIAKGGEDIYNVTQFVIGAIETLSGLALVIGFLTGNAPLIIGGAIGTIVGVIGELGNEISKSKDSLYEFNKKYKETKESVDSGLTSYRNQLRAYQDLAGELKNLVDANGKVKEGYEDRVSYILNELNNAFGTEYELVNGMITKNGIYLKSMQDIENEIGKYVQIKQGQYLLEKYEDLKNEALDKSNEKQAKLNALEKEYKKQKEELIKKYGEQDQRVDELDKKYEFLAGNINREYNDATLFLKDYSALSEAVTTGNLAEIERLTNKFYTENDSSVKKYTKQVKTYFSELTGEVQNSKTLSQQVSNALSNDMSASGKTAGQSWKNAFANSVNANGGLKINTSVSANGSGKVTLTARANGGFVDTGQMFVARENGIPELVGRIGRKTAVANNDQIVEAVASGVARANMMTKPKQKIEIIAEGDASGLLDFITFKQKEKNRQYGF